MSSVQAWGWHEEASGTLDALPGMRRGGGSPGTVARWGRSLAPFWDTGRVAGWSARARQTTRAVGARVGQTSSTVYRYVCSTGVGSRI